MRDNNNTFLKFLKDWMLVIGILAGIGLYFAYRAMPVLHPAAPVFVKIIKTAQPVLLFMMLFLSFCKIEPRRMKPRRWMAELLAFQCLVFAVLAVLLIFVPGIPFRMGIEAAMLCFICPTATACAVVTGKLGGDMAGVVTYTVLINIATAILVPLAVPLIHPMEGLNFVSAFAKILAKVFPLLIMPCLLAWFVRYCLPGVHAFLLRYTGLSFYIWAVSLTLAILMSTRAIWHNEGSAIVLVEIAVASLAACAIQFAAGRKIGARHGCLITAGQSLGQKNTVFGIWMGYTFMTPVVSVAGGFYSIWHNCYNTWQLYKKRKADEAASGC